MLHNFQVNFFLQYEWHGNFKDYSNQVYETFSSADDLKIAKTNHVKAFLMSSLVLYRYYQTKVSVFESCFFLHVMFSFKNVLTEFIALA